MIPTPSQSFTLIAARLPARISYPFARPRLQQALEKAREDVSALKRNTFDKEQADRLAEELQQSQGSYAAEHVRQLPPRRLTRGSTTTS